MSIHWREHGRTFLRSFVRAFGIGIVILYCTMLVPGIRPIKPESDR